MIMSGFSTSTMFITTPLLLPADVWKLLSSFLPLSSLVALCRTCRTLSRVARALISLYYARRTTYVDEELRTSAGVSAVRRWRMGTLILESCWDARLVGNQTSVRHGWRAVGERGEGHHLAFESRLTSRSSDLYLCLNERRLHYHSSSDGTITLILTDEATYVVVCVPFRQWP
jgi:hypothetical protein